MTEVVLDASAILAFLRREVGADVVRPHLYGGQLLAVNYAEVLAKAAEINIAVEATEGILNDLGVKRVPFDDRHAKLTASLRSMTREYGLSLADRACLALALERRLPVLTADRVWATIGLDLDIRVIR